MCACVCVVLTCGTQVGSLAIVGNHTSTYSVKNGFFKLIVYCLETQKLVVTTKFLLYENPVVTTKAFL